MDRRGFFAWATAPAAGLLASDPGLLAGFSFGARIPARKASGAQDREQAAAAIQELIDSARSRGEQAVVVPDRLLPYPASLVEFKPSVVLLRRGQKGGIVDAAAYGAAGYGDEGMDDASLTAAHEAAERHGVPLALPAGHVYVTSMRTRTSVTSSPDRPATIRRPTGLDGPVLSVEASDVTVRHLQVDGVGDEVGEPPTAGIRLADVNDCRITRCLIHDTAGPGITMRGRGNRVVGNRLERCHRRRGAIETEASTVQTVIADNLLLDSGHHGIRVANTGTRGTIVRGNHIETTGGAGILQEVRATDTLITNNTVLDADGNGIKVEDGESAVVSDNAVRHPGANGIFVHGNPGSSVTGNVISHATLRGIAVATRADGTSVTGNTILEPDGDGLLLADSSGCVVTGNSIRGPRGHGVLIKGGASGYAVTGNTVGRASGEAVRDESRDPASRVDLNAVQ